LLMAKTYAQVSGRVQARGGHIVAL
jgi:hypothetical protein